MGGLEPAGDLIRRSLKAGKSVVTANKQLISTHGVELLALARQQQRELLFEASVAGGIPIVRAVREGLAGDRLLRVAGILNGTCNYILTRMDSAGLSFADALKEAQALGFAEADPTADVDGYDARAKIAILIAVGLGCQVDPEHIPCRSISSIDRVDFTYARKLDCTIRQISWAERAPGPDTQLFASVRPALVPLSSPLARAQGSQNLVTVNGEFGGETTYSGFGAGGDPTAVAVVSDLMSIARAGLGAEVHLPQELEGQVEVEHRLYGPALRALHRSRPSGYHCFFGCAPVGPWHQHRRGAAASRPRQSRAAVRDDARGLPGVGAGCGARRNQRAAVSRAAPDGGAGVGYVEDIWLT